MPRYSSDSSEEGRHSASSTRRPASRPATEPYRDNRLSHGSRDSLDSELESTDSYSSDDDRQVRLRDEEEQVGSTTAAKGGEKWTMRSVGKPGSQKKSATKSTGGPKYASVPAADANGSSGDESTDPGKPPSKRSTSAAGTSAPVQTSTGGGAKSKVAWAVLALVVVLILVGGIGAYYYTTRDKTSSASDDPLASNATSISNSTDDSTTTSTDLSAALTTSAASQTSALSTGVSTAALSLTTTVSPIMESTAAEKTSKTQHTSGGDGQTATATKGPDEPHPTSTAKTGEEPGATGAKPSSATARPTGEPKKYETSIVPMQVHDSGEEVGPCGTKPEADSRVFYVPRNVWGVDERSPWCGRWLTTWWPDSDQTVMGTVQGLCEACDSTTMAVSAALYSALIVGIAEDSVPEDGLEGAQFWITPADADGRYPSDGLKTASVPTA